MVPRAMVTERKYQGRCFFLGGRWGLVVSNIEGLRTFMSGVALCVDQAGFR
ncbi:MAG: hypothetical protein LBK44_05700 [Spirochaetales bacterium]|nr:hypothetical protein [Spirochaetales bacterium]